MTFDSKISTAAGQASEDADDRAEVMMRKSIGTIDPRIARAVNKHKVV